MHEVDLLLPTYRLFLHPSLHSFSLSPFPLLSSQLPPAIASAKLSSLPVPPGLCATGRLGSALFMGRFILLAMSGKYDFIKVRREGGREGGREEAGMFLCHLYATLTAIS